MDATRIAMKCNRCGAILAYVSVTAIRGALAFVSTMIPFTHRNPKSVVQLAQENGDILCVDCNRLIQPPTDNAK